MARSTGEALEIIVCSWRLMQSKQSGIDVFFRGAILVSRGIFPDYQQDKLWRLAGLARLQSCAHLEERESTERRATLATVVRFDRRHEFGYKWPQMRYHSGIRLREGSILVEYGSKRWFTHQCPIQRQYRQRDVH